MLFTLVVLASCAQRLVPPSGPVPPVNGLSAGLRPGPALKLDPVSAERASRAFLTSCPALLRRQDTSGLTRPEDWSEACRALAALPADAPGKAPAACP